MDKSKLLVTAATRLPRPTFERVIQFAWCNELVKNSGAPNISHALAALVEAGLDAQAAQTAKSQAVEK